MRTNVVDLIIQDHRDIQALFVRLRRGEGDRLLLFQQMAALLTAHSRAEEAEVYPQIARATTAEEVTHARQEHAEADELLARLKKMDPDSSEFDDGLTRLMQTVEEHIREEESVTLPALRERSDREQLVRLGEAFLRRRGAELEHGPSTHQVGGSELSKQKLYALAGEYGIAGRSRMSKGELLEAVKSAQNAEHVKVGH